MTAFFLTDETRQQIREVLRMRGNVKKLSFDCSSWAEDNGTVTTATWTVESGSVSISSEALASNVARCITTTNTAGSSMIKLLITDGTHSEAVYIRLLTKDPQVTSTVPDYGLLWI